LKFAGGVEKFDLGIVGGGGTLATLSSIEASVDRLGFLGGGIGGKSPVGTEEAETTALDPWLDALDFTEFCDIWVYETCWDVLEVCRTLLAVDESSSSARILGDDRTDEGREKELAVDVGVEVASDLLSEVSDHLANALDNFLAGRRPLPNGNGDVVSSNLGEAGSVFVTDVMTVEASLQQGCCQSCVSTGISRQR
jgi:hypothetical protein